MVQSYSTHSTEFTGVILKINFLFICFFIFCWIQTRNNNSGSMRIRIHNTALYNHRFHSIVGCLHQRSFYREHIFRHLQPNTAATHNLDTWDGRMTRALVFQTNMSFHVIHASCFVVTLLARPLWHVRMLELSMPVQLGLSLAHKVTLATPHVPAG